MKSFVFALVLGLFVRSAHADDVAVLAASATSSSADSTDITCLLDSKCNGKWQPASRDEGVDEGMYLQFSEAIPLYSIEVDIADENTKPSLALYLNGKTTGPDDVVYVQSQEKNADRKTVTYTFTGRNEEDFQGSLHTNARSVFIKIGKSYAKETRKPTVKAIRFYRRSKTDDPKKVVTTVMQFKLPKVVPVVVNASSILPPTTAYDPANLFDSRYDFAWSTDGAKTNGIGEKLDLTFAREVNIAGIYVWNGYQRSTTHFEKNGRVKSLNLTTAQGDSQYAALGSTYGMQKIALTKPLMQVKQLSLEIADIYPGSAYKDVLISELRFVDDKGNILLPAAPLPKLTYDKKWNEFLDRSWSTFLHGIAPGPEECFEGCNNKSLRLRSNGTFVIYLDFGSVSNDGSESANVLEGNWTVEQDKLRIFGKRYATQLRSSDYIKAEKTRSVPTANLFQSYITVTRYNDLSKAEQEGILQAMIKRRPPVKDAGIGFSWVNTCKVAVKPEPGGLFADTWSGLMSSTRKYLEKINPYYVESSVVTDLFMPTDSVYGCGGGC